MKKAVALILSICLVFALCGCGKSAPVLAVEEAIAALGEISLESEDAIKAAEEAFAALSDKEKEKVENAAELTAARETYDTLLEEYKQQLAREEEEAARKAAEFEAARMALVGDWVCPRTDAHVFLHLSEDGTAKVVSRWGKEGDFTWSLTENMLCLLLDGPESHKLVLGQLGGFPAITGYTVFKDDEPALIKYEDFQALADKYYTIVELNDENMAEYIGTPVQLAKINEDFGAFARPNLAREKGLIYVGMREEVSVKYSGLYRAVETFPVIGSNGPFAAYFDINVNELNPGKLIHAKGVLIFVSEEFVESVELNSSGTSRDIKMKDGFTIFDRSQITDEDLGRPMLYAFQADLQY